MVYVILVTKRPQSDIQHVDALTFLATALEVKNNRVIQIYLQKKATINMEALEFSNVFVDSSIYVNSLKMKVYMVTY